MPGRHVFDLLEIPDAFWRHADVLSALRRRDVGCILRLLNKRLNISQTRIAIACDTTQPKISAYMRGLAKVEELRVFDRIADGLNMPDRARIELGLAPKTGPADLLNAVREGSREDDGFVRRRTFVGLTGASLFGAVLAEPARSGPAEAIDSFAAVLAAYSPEPAGIVSDEPDLPALSAAVARAKRDYQACRYSDVVKDLPWLLNRLQAACAVAGGQERLRLCTLCAEAHHVAASILVKGGDQGLGWLAADRSMRAAEASGDPVTVASSARIITHALMNSKHYVPPADMARSRAAEFDRITGSHDPESLSVYGSLLLRGAIAAAQHDDRRNAYDLLTEAEDAATRLGTDRNLRWTAFGPTNASLHRVNIAVTLGDAGTALDVARTVDLSKIDVTERKASFLMDTARAFLQCGKHERAYLSLRAAEEIAPEEITGRPAARQMVRDLLSTAPPSVQPQASTFAHRVWPSE